MDTSVDIHILKLAAGYLLFIIPVAVFFYFRTGLIKDTLWAVSRMTLQLGLVAVYLEYVFLLNNKVVNILWLIALTAIAAYTIIKRSNISYRLFLISVFLSTLASVVIIDMFFIGFLLKPEYLFDARYLIPITGIMLGNTLRTNIIALNSYFSRLERDQLLYRYALANGATRDEALQPYIREALRQAFNPAIANMSVVGLINFPGVMTGQLIGGTNPATAIKYQLMIMVAIFVSSVIIVFFSLKISNKLIFDHFDNPCNQLTRIK